MKVTVNPEMFGSARSGLNIGLDCDYDISLFCQY